MGRNKNFVAHKGAFSMAKESKISRIIKVGIPQRLENNNRTL